MHQSLHFSDGERILHPVSDQTLQVVIDIVHDDKNVIRVFLNDDILDESFVSILKLKRRKKRLTLTVQQFSCSDLRIQQISRSDMMGKPSFSLPIFNRFNTTISSNEIFRNDVFGQFVSVSLVLMSWARKTTS